MANMTFKANLLPDNTGTQKELGSSTAKWNIYGDLHGNATTATTATKLGTDNKGSGTKPIYLAAGVPTECSKYAGGTKVTLNGSSKGSSTASFYAPTSAGTSGQLLKSNGSDAPGWITTSIGSSMQPIYLSSGAPTACTIPSSGAWWSAVPQILSDGVMEVGKYIDFHTTSNGTTDYDVRITAATTGLTISGTTVGTFSGDLSGNAATATILKSQNTASTATTEVSSWYTPTDWKHVWGQRFKDTSISTDTGDICFKLSPVYTYDSSGTLTGTNSSQSQLFMMIDGGIHIQNTFGDASSTHNCEKRNIPLMIGAPHYNHMEFDANEIMVKTSDTAMGTLRLNNNLEILANGFISRAGFGTAWIYGRTGAVVRTSSCPNGSYCTIYSLKTGRGSWECGSYNYNNGDNLYWTYIKDSRTENGTDGQAWLAPGGEYHATKVWGAVYNDYAEMRNVPEAQIENNSLKPGTCVREIGNGTMVATTKRLQRGCKIISDTFGFNIGETEDCKTPIAVSGRALVYLDQDREIARDYIGWPVCSGPNGTVSIMTEEEEEKYPSRIVGTISEIPDYEKWGSSDVEVNGRIWIYVR